MNSIIVDDSSDEDEIDVVVSCCEDDSDAENIDDLQFIASSVEPSVSGCIPPVLGVEDFDPSRASQLAVDAEELAAVIGDQSSSSDSEEYSDDAMDNNESSDEGDMNGEDEDIDENIVAKTANEQLDDLDYEYDDVVAGTMVKVPRNNQNETVQNDDKIAENEELQYVGDITYRIDHEKSMVIQSSSSCVPETAVSENVNVKAVLPNLLMRSSKPPSLLEGTQICTIDRIIVGKVHEIFGPISKPFYVLKWRTGTSNNNSTSKKSSKKKFNKKREKVEVKDCNSAACDTAASSIEASDTSTLESKDVLIPVTPTEPVESHFLTHVLPTLVAGVALYCVVPSSTHKSTYYATPNIIRSTLAISGSDASNVYDEEVANNEQDYSDDEAEAAAKKALKPTKPSQKKKASNSMQHPMSRKTAVSGYTVPSMIPAAGTQYYQQVQQPQPAMCPPQQFQYSHSPMPQYQQMGPPVQQMYPHLQPQPQYQTAPQYAPVPVYQLPPQPLQPYAQSVPLQSMAQYPQQQSSLPYHQSPSLMQQQQFPSTVQGHHHQQFVPQPPTQPLQQQPVYNQNIPLSLPRPPDGAP